MGYGHRAAVGKHQEPRSLVIRVERDGYLGICTASYAGEQIWVDKAGLGVGHRSQWVHHKTVACALLGEY
jgi:hypothetical protein